MQVSDPCHLVSQPLGNDRPVRAVDLYIREINHSDATDFPNGRIKQHQYVVARQMLQAIFHAWQWCCDFALADCTLVALCSRATLPPDGSLRDVDSLTFLRPAVCMSEMAWASGRRIRVAAGSPVEPTVKASCVLAREVVGVADNSHIVPCREAV